MFMSNRGDDTLVHSEPSFGVNNFNKPKDDLLNNRRKENI